MNTRRYTLTLETVEPFHIGATKSPLSSVHSPVMRIGERVIIPGSSLKGALRAEVERFLIEKYKDAPGMKPCIPSPWSGLSKAEQELIPVSYKKDGACKYEEPDKNKPKTLHDWDYICPACYLFGAQGLVGMVRVPFLFTDARSEELYSVRIDRASQTVAEGMNRNYQLIAPGAKFTGVLEVLLEDSVRDWKLGIARKLPADATHGDEWLKGGTWTADRIVKELIVDRLQAIKLLGGFKSKGAGGVKITVTEAK